MHQLIDKKKYLILYFLFFVALSTTTNKNLYKDEKLFQIENIIICTNVGSLQNTFFAKNRLKYV